MTVGNRVGNGTVLLVACSSSSYCQPENDIVLFVYKNETDGPLQHPDFKCETHFKSDSWLVSCKGTFEKKAIVGFDRISCRLHLKHQTEKESTEVVMSTDKFLCDNSEGM